MCSPREARGMYFKQILDERCGCASYVIASRETHEAAVVDPSVHLAEYDALLAERKFTLRYVLDTHVHADHLSGARALAAEHGAELGLHEAAPVVYPFRKLHDVKRQLDWPVATIRLAGR